MQPVLPSILLLTLLLAIGLVFFLRAASKDRTTVVDIHSPKPPLEVLNGLSEWLLNRGWKPVGSDPDRQVLRFQGTVASSPILMVLLSIFGVIGAGCLGLVLVELYPLLGWWPLLLAGIGPIAGFFYNKKANRIEVVELRLTSSEGSQGSTLRVRAHRDELIAMELELANRLELASDGALLSSPI